MGGASSSQRHHIQPSFILFIVVFVGSILCIVLYDLRPSLMIKGNTDDDDDDDDAES